MDEQKLPATEVFQAQLDNVKTSSAVFGDSFRVYLQLLSKHWLWFVGISGFFSISMLFILNDDSLFSLSYSDWFNEKLRYLLPSSSAPLGWVVYVVSAAAMATLFGNFWRNNPDLKAPAEEREPHSLKFVVLKFASSCVIVFAHSTPLLIDNEFGILLYLIILPFMLVWLAGIQCSELGFADASSLVLKNAFSGLSRHYSIFMSLGIIGIFFFLLSDSILPLIDTSVLNWNFRVDEMSYYWIKLGIVIFMTSAALFFLLPLLLTGMAFSFYSYREISEAHGLMERLQKHGFVKE
jgi:hypothetical protein